MKRALRLLLLILIGMIGACAVSYFTDKGSVGEWTFLRDTAPDTSLFHSKFIWTNDTLGGKYMEKTAMLIPAQIDGLPVPVNFQFDLGAERTGIYENSFKSFYPMFPGLSGKIRRMKSFLQFWNKNKVQDLSFRLDFYHISNPQAFVYMNYGESFSVTKENVNDTFHMGTIGADLFKNQVLIIDYPNQRFAIRQKVPAQYRSNLVDIELDPHNRVILPLTIKGKKYRVLFDNGSSIFPLTARSSTRANFSSNPVIDSLLISSWGEKHMLNSRMITDSFELAGKKFCNVKVYENHTGKGIDPNTDAMTGNYLFLRNTIVIDFINKKFGIY